MEASREKAPQDEAEGIHIRCKRVGAPSTDQFWCENQRGSGRTSGVLCNIHAGIGYASYSVVSQDDLPSWRAKNDVGSFDVCVNYMRGSKKRQSASQAYDDSLELMNVSR